MEFPVYISLGFARMHPHLLFETLAYFIGFRLYMKLRPKNQLSSAQGLWIVIGAISGAALGSKLLYWLENPGLTSHHLLDPVYLMEGKTIVGGLLGGLIGVELMKKKLNYSRSTGDAMVLPLIVGMSIGRIGCFLSGVTDRTYGNPTSFPTGMDLGDGILRHPTSLYEIVFLLSLGLFLSLTSRYQPFQYEGARFQWFMLGYLSYRLLIDFIKPTFTAYGPFTSIQLAALLGIIYYLYLIQRSYLRERNEVHA
ncbi:prolipoprotein diacylglyceryl transferase [Marinicrinis sediminis]|uniref:Prolipoprotein diacylglyceryl transferase n=1 Tax=Marinicrinis sediminis TaxID=1652465 RepID=A0ABW5RHD1_9BACL